MENQVPLLNVISLTGAERICLSRAAVGKAGKADAPFRNSIPIFFTATANSRHIISPSLFSCQTFPRIENSQVLPGWHPIRGKIAVYSW